MEASLDSEPRPRGWRHAALLILILALASALRFWGLKWGLPNTLHEYSYHPDEFLTIGAAFVTIYIGRTWNPGFYNYPSLYLYLSALAMAVALGWGVTPAAGTIYLIPRVMTALMGVGAVAATYWAGRVLYDEAIGLLAALAICVAPLHVQHSHFATVDVPSTLFVALALGFSGLILKRGSWRDYLLAGAMSGLAAGTKYNAGLIILSPIAAHFLRDGINCRSICSGRLWAIVGCTLAVFVISTPGSLFATQQFMSGITYEMRHASEGHGLVFAGTGSGFVYTFASSLWYGLGPGLSVLFAAAVIWAIWRRDKPCLLALAFIVPYYVLISASHVRFARYALPVFPAAAILIGWFVLQWDRRPGERRALMARGCLWAIICVAGLVLALGSSLDMDCSFASPNARDKVACWVFSHVPKGSSIGMIDWPWFYSPPLSRNLGLGTLPQRQAASEDAPYRLAVLASGSDAWQPAPDWVIISDYETMDAGRLKGNKSISIRDQQEVERTLAALSFVTKHYRVRRVFGGRCRVLDWESAIPHDMRYPDPVITIYERRK